MRADPRLVTRRLAELYPDAHCHLHHRNPFELLVATVLSAQTTDARVNTVTPELFRRWPDPASLAGAGLADVQEVVRPLGFQRRRAGQLVELSRRLVSDFAGQVPADREDLMTLPGVGRKTANVVLGNAFGVPAITVDTHVGRLARRLGWTSATDPRLVEDDIAAALPGEDWTIICHRLIDHGRAVCHSRRPACATCALASLCPRIGVAALG